MPPSYTASRAVLITIVLAVLLVAVLLLARELPALWQQLVETARTLVDRTAG